MLGSGDEDAFAKGQSSNSNKKLPILKINDNIIQPKSNNNRLGDLEDTMDSSVDITAFYDPRMSSDSKFDWEEAKNHVDPTGYSVNVASENRVMDDFKKAFREKRK